MLEIAGKPVAFKLPPGRTALVMIDMQRDFLLKDGFGYLQCNSEEVFNEVSKVIDPCQKALKAARALGMTIIHTREGHEPDLRDLPPSKLLRQSIVKPGNYPFLIGDEGPLGRLLVRGSWGHDLIEELNPLRNEVVLDKPGKGSFFNTDLHQILVTRGITHLVIGGVTTECCVATTFREANDHGFECCVLTDCTSGFNKAIYDQTINTFCAYDGLLGFISTGTELVILAEQNEMTLKTRDQTVMSVDWLHANYKLGDTDPESFIQELIKKCKRLNLTESLVLPDFEPQEVTDMPNLYGVPFMVDTSVGQEAAIVRKLSQEGALFIGVTEDIDSVIGNNLATFVLAVDAGSIQTTFPSFTPSLGMVSLTRTQYGSTSSLCIVSRSIKVIRTVFSIARSYDPEDATSKEYFEYPIKPVDFRSVEDGGFRFASNLKVCRNYLTNTSGREEPFDWDIIAQTEELVSPAQSHASWKELVLLQKKFRTSLLSTLAPEIIVTETAGSTREISRLMYVPYFETNGMAFTGDYGQDGRFLDIVEYLITK